MDLAYFFATSLSEDVYHNNLDNLMEIYHETLISVMDRLGCKTRAPSMNELQTTLKKFAIYELSATFLVTPVTMSCLKNDEEIDEAVVKSSDEWIDKRNLRNPNYKNLIVNRLPIIFGKMGI